MNKSYMLGMIIGLTIIIAILIINIAKQKEEIEILKQKTNDMQEKIRQVKWEIEETYYICGLNER